MLCEHQRMYTFENVYIHNKYNNGPRRTITERNKQNVMNSLGYVMTKNNFTVYVLERCVYGADGTRFAIVTISTHSKFRHTFPIMVFLVEIAKVCFFFVYV